MVDRVRALFGIETEYALSVVGGPPSFQERAVRRLYERAAARPHLPGVESGIFLPNGGRFYIDSGFHPEYASPETTNPWDAVRYALAGDRHIWQLADETAALAPELSGLVVRKGNVDYVHHTTWGSHENYLHQRSPAILKPGLVAHLVSRIVLTGSGGFEPLAASPSFVLSPRALFVRRLIAASSPGALALVDERNQPHCRDFYRQHVMCADATQSQLSTLLRIGTTALVVALIDAGCTADAECALTDPLKALSTVARDLTLSERLPMTSGSAMTAIEIQRHYLRQARAHLNRLPEWAEQLCEVWEDTLARLDHGPAAVADRLDWAIKQALFERHTARRTDADAASPLQELYEIDLRFGQVYPTSLFQSLDDAGVLHHRIIDAAEIESAVSTPPADGRAHIRGIVVTRLAGQAGVQCAWDAVRDSRSRRALDLTSPFTSAEDWSDLAAGDSYECALVGQLVQLSCRPPSETVTGLIRDIARQIMADARSARTSEHAIELNNSALLMRRAARLEDSEWLLRAALAIELAARPLSGRKLPHRRNNLASVLLMQGRASEAREQVTLAWRVIGSRYDRTSARILVVRLAIAFVAGEPADVLIGQVKRHLTMEPLPDFADVERHWRVHPMLEALAARLTLDQHMLLKGVVDVLNGDRLLVSMEGVPLWRRASEQPLDAPWPA